MARVIPPPPPPPPPFMANAILNFHFFRPSLSQSRLQYIYFLDAIDISNVTLRINAKEFSLQLKKNPEIESQGFVT